MAQYIVLTEFDNKIEAMKDHEKYRWLKAQADKAKQMFDSFGLDRIRGEDFIERIAAMPLDYISDWLDGKNELTWRAEDRNMLDAIKSGCVHILEQHPGSMIRRIGNGAEKFYLECGWEVAERNENDLVVYKEGEQT